MYFKTHEQSSRSQQSQGPKPSSSSPRIIDCSKQLGQVKLLMQEMQCTLLTFSQRSSELLKKNKQILTENKKLKEKIKQLELSQRDSQPAKSPSNTTQLTKESDWFRSFDSISITESSTDSIMILNSQVEHVKEFRAKNCKEEVINIHKKTNSIDKSAQFERIQTEGPRKNRGRCQENSANFPGKNQDLGSEKCGKNFLRIALVQNIPALR